MARVALVNLPFQGRIASVAQTSVGPPLGLAYVAAVLRDAGHAVRILDDNALGLGWRRLAEELRAFAPQVVGCTAATPSLGLAAALARLVRGLLPDASFVLGGPHGTALPEQTLREHPDFDVVVIGEAEPFADDLMRALTGEGELAAVPSIALRRDGEVLRSSAPSRSLDIDALPFPARELLPNRRYRTIDAWPMTCMLAMRGCPAGCTYCSVPRIAGRDMRRRAPQSIVAEMQESLGRWGVGFVSFLDDTFTTSAEWTHELCDALIEARLPGRVAWSCLTRPDMVDRELLAHMKAAGLVRVEFGIESGSPDVLRRLGKGVRLEQIREAFALAHGQGLTTLGFMMLNSPHETPAEMERTAREALRIDPTFLQLTYCTPYPGTPLYEQCREEGLVDSWVWEDFRFLRAPVIRNDTLSAAEVQAKHAEIMRRFYLRPSKLRDLVRYALHAPGAARSLAYTSALALGHLRRG